MLKTLLLWSSSLLQGIAAAWQIVSNIRDWLKRRKEIPETPLVIKNPRLIGGLILGLVATLCIGLWLMPNPLPHSKPDQSSVSVTSAPSLQAPAPATASLPSAIPDRIRSGGHPKHTPTVESPKPTVLNNAPSGFAISGGIVTNPTVNNYRTPVLQMNDAQMAAIVAAMMPYKGRDPMGIMIESGSTAENEFGDRLCYALRQAGLCLGIGYTMTGGRGFRPPEGLYIVTDDDHRDMVEALKTAIDAVIPTKMTVRYIPKILNPMEINITPYR